MSTAHEADVVVIGGGGSGLAAASEAARLGRKVILLEKNPQLGGSTAWSIGSVSAINTPHQRRAGITDSADEHFEDLGLLAGPLASRDNLRLRRIFVDRTSETFEWLLSLGLVFLGPMPEPPNRHPRMHNIVPNSRAFPYHLGRHARAVGVDIRTAMAAKELMTEGGRVIGVRARGADGTDHTFHAKRGVILASGDYSGGRELKSRYAGELAANAEAVNVTNTGDGHHMALALGASVINGDIVRGPVIRFVPPKTKTIVQQLPPTTLMGHVVRLAMDYVPATLLRPFLMSFVTTALGPEPALYQAGAVLVNGKGERFTDELGKPANDLGAQPGGVAYIILDGVIARQFTAYPYFVSTAPSVAYAYVPDYKTNRKDIYHEAATLEDLTQQLGIPAGPVHSALQQTVGQRRNTPMEGPYVALGPVKSYVTLADGGLKVSDNLEVIGPGEQPIPGLFAAGAAGQGGLLLYGHGHHLCWAFVSGRLAGAMASR